MNPIYLHDCHGARCGWMCTELSASVIFSVLYLCENICCSSTGRDPTVYVKCVSKSKQLHRCELPLRLAYCSNGLLGGVSKFLEGPATGQFHRVFFSMVFLSRRENTEPVPEFNVRMLLVVLPHHQNSRLNAAHPNLPNFHNRDVKITNLAKNVLTVHCQSSYSTRFPTPHSTRFPTPHSTRFPTLHSTRFPTPHSTRFPPVQICRSCTFTSVL